MNDDDDERIGVRDVRDPRISDMGPSNSPSLCLEAYHSVGPEPPLLLFWPIPSPTREGTPIRASDQSRIFFQLKKGLPSDSFPMPWTREECGLPQLQRLVAVGREEELPRKSLLQSHLGPGSVWSPRSRLCSYGEGHGYNLKILPLKV